MEQQLEEIASNFGHTTAAQLRHRMSLVEFWAPKAGDRVLEIGCGQGDCTVVLAHAVGERGKVVATDIAPPEYGAPVSLRDTHRSLLSSAPWSGSRSNSTLAPTCLIRSGSSPANTSILRSLRIAHGTCRRPKSSRTCSPVYGLGPSVLAMRRGTQSPGASGPSPGCDSSPGPYPLLLAGAWYREPAFADHAQPSPLDGGGCGMGHPR